MSSFLELGKGGWGKTVRTSNVRVDTLDNFLKEHKISGQIDILKCDTQGYDLEVFKGSEMTMGENRIKLIYSEHIFSDMFRSVPRFDEVFGYLSDNGFSLVSPYKTFYQNNLASWTDMLWINNKFHKTISGDNKIS